MGDEQGQLADRQAIHDVLVDYCRLLDCMELDALAALFTVDCTIDFGPDTRLNSRGRAALARSLERMWRWSRTSHHLSNVQIRFTGPVEATALSYVLAWHERPDGSTATVYGQYRDRLERQGDNWLIARRSMLENGSDQGFTVNLHRLDRRPAPSGWIAPAVDAPVLE